MAGLFFYLSLYTWNLRTGHLDTFATWTGLEISSWVLRPGKWAVQKVSHFWNSYVFLVGEHTENLRLRSELQQLLLENLRLQEQAKKASRLEDLLHFRAPQQWQETGARVVGHRLGALAALETIIIDKGDISQVFQDMPVITPQGLVGRVFRVGLSASTVLLLQDSNSAVPVISRESRLSGIVYGSGPGKALAVRYININAPLEQGETFVTSGLSGIYPKGIPVARVTHVEHSQLSLFLKVEAKPVVDPSQLEEVLLLSLLRAKEKTQ